MPLRPSLSASLPFRLLPLLWLLSGSAVAGEGDAPATSPLPFTATYRLAPEGYRSDPGRLYAPPTSAAAPRSRRLWRQELELRSQGGLPEAAGQGRWNSQLTLRADDTPGQGPREQHGIVNQAYVDTPSRDGQAFTFGKKSVPWGVGFGFRPLDVVQRENRRQLNPPALVGIPQLSWEQSDARTAFTLLWQNPGQGWQAGADRLATPERDSALAAHFYQLDGEQDWHAVARYSDRYRLEAGAGVSAVSGDHWVWHGAVLRQQRLSLPTTALPPEEMPLRPRGGGANRAVAGMQWTGEEVSLLLETWYDGSAPSRRDWQALSARLAGASPGSSLTPPPAAALGSAAPWLSRPNLHRDNLLLRLSWEREQRWQAAGELLYHPADGGRMYTLSGSWKGDRQQFTLGWRAAAGPADAMLRQTPLARALWLEWRLALH